MRRTGLKGLAILFVAVLIGGVTLVVNSNAADTIKIGFVADVSGIGATFYKSQKAAIDLFIEQANAGGGILGKKLEVVVRDAQLKPDIGANMARELILAEKCDFLIGPTSSAVALAVTKVSKEFKKVVYFHTSNTEALTTTDYQPYMFQVVPNTVIEGRGIAQFLSKKPFTKYVYIGPDYAYGHTQYNSFKDRMAKLKPDAKILETIWVKVGETNYSPYIPTLMAKDPQVLFTSLWGGGSATFIKQAKPYGFFNKTSITSLYDL
ncbi:MAG: ABC transporter substrate-binding protein, partial [Thermodesulfobacteriota bacterium]